MTWAYNDGRVKTKTIVWDKDKDQICIYNNDYYSYDGCYNNYSSNNSKIDMIGIMIKKIQMLE